MIQPDDAVLITGCGGMLGHAVRARFLGRARVVATDLVPSEPWLSPLDVTSAAAVEEAFVRVRPRYVVHLAAVTDLECCERRPALAYDVNTWGTHNVAVCAARAGVPMLSLSTAGVFDGAKSAYAEEDVAQPLSVYGKSKYGGDLAVGALPRGVILRAGWMMGGGPARDKKFVWKVIRQVREGARRIAAVDDKFGSPSYVRDVAEAAYYLLDHGHTGLFHGGSDGGGPSRYDVAAAILGTLGVDGRVELVRARSEAFADEYFAPRPASEQLDNRRLKGLHAPLVRDWRDCLKDYLDSTDWGL
ncbi:MAG TPA: NAD(P)-dependent oxidoreductase [Vicinamibacteria bacterium]|jgi:dTDP-4-dehydrorhamnose reductase